MRIASLVPSATETLFALGLGPDVVGVTHECDYPPDAAELPHLTRTVIPEGLSSEEIDAAVRERTERGEHLYELDAERLHELAPDLIVTQALCEVCAVSFDDVRAVAEEMESQPQVLALDPTTLGEVLSDVRRLAEATDDEGAADELLDDAADRIDAVRGRLADAPIVPVVALEWLAPPYIAGHWVPQLVELAGGVDSLGLPGERSRTAGWDEVRAAEPQVVVVMPCGLDVRASADEALDHHARLAELGAERVVAVDATSYFSRPSPRLVDGLEILAHALHPNRAPDLHPGAAIVVG
ncbi:MAG TPA: ABC transporter substrate-binding protein [Thermoleophilaceae bacterium]|nr:ABC transporter substrate-binding protein [Thermoleophilaceae bacterium]